MTCLQLGGQSTNFSSIIMGQKILNHKNFRGINRLTNIFIAVRGSPHIIIQNQKKIKRPGDKTSSVHLHPQGCLFFVPSVYHQVLSLPMTVKHKK